MAVENTVDKRNFDENPLYLTVTNCQQQGWLLYMQIQQESVKSTEIAMCTAVLQFATILCPISNRKYPL